MHVFAQDLISYCFVKSGDTSTNGMGVWWENYQEMSIDQKEAVIRQYNRQRTKSRRKLAEVDDVKTTEIEPLVNVPEPKIDVLKRAC